MKKQRIPLLLVLGILLVLISLSLMIFYQVRMHLGVQQSQRIVSELDRILPERTAGVPGIYLDPGMPVLQIEGVDYVAMIEIPSFDVTLPVANKWNVDQLSDAPARFFGSAYDSTLIIGGTDHPQQFRFCDAIEHGALVIVTDMTGTQFTYAVSAVDRAEHAQTQWLTEGDCDLTLFCHDVYSMEYIAVRCVLAYR